MTSSHWHRLINNVRRTALAQDGAGTTDNALLSAFLAGRDEAAFAALVRRHGPMVLGVCRRVLGNVHDAEDAFQACFLVLACKAATVLPREMLGSWLYGVAYRTALHARRTMARRAAREKQVSAMPDAEVKPEKDWQEIQAILDEELNGLAAKYRLPIVLCDLEGRTRREVARQLKIPDGTLSNRLATARKLLASRLTRQGVTLSSGAIAAALAQQAASAGVSASLVGETARAAAAVAIGEATVAVSADVVALSKGVMQAMFLCKLKALALVLIVVAMIGVGALSTGKLAWGQTDGQTDALEKLAARRESNHERVQQEPAKIEGKQSPDAVERDWKGEFQKLYGLKDGEVLRRMAPPFPECREKLFDEKGKADPSTAFRDTDKTYMFFRYQKNKTEYGTGHQYGPFHVATPPPGSLSFILEQGFLFPTQQVDAAAELLDTDIHGEFVFRHGTPPEKWVPVLDKILRTECKLPVRLTLKEVEREVIVMSGEYQARPRKGQKANTIVLSSEEPMEDWSGSGLGDCDAFVRFLNKLLDRHVVSEVKAPPERLWWRHKSGLMTSVRGRNLYIEEDRDPDVVLKYVTEQTGLAFKTAKRKVPVLFVERAE
jgi:RNA polymerase sigma factor (sigma-70 family)